MRIPDQREFNQEDRGYFIVEVQTPMAVFDDGGFATASDLGWKTHPSVIQISSYLQMPSRVPELLHSTNDDRVAGGLLKDL